MKYITLIIGLLVVGCATIPEVKSIAGTYETDRYGAVRLVFLENSVMKRHNYTNEGRLVQDILPESMRTSYIWSITKEGIHVKSSIPSVKKTHIIVYRINQDESITSIAKIVDRGIFGAERINWSKEDQVTYKKIK